MNKIKKVETRNTYFILPTIINFRLDREIHFGWLNWIFYIEY